MTQLQRGDKIHLVSKTDNRTWWERRAPYWLGGCDLPETQHVVTAIYPEHGYVTTTTAPVVVKDVPITQQERDAAEKFFDKVSTNILIAPKPKRKTRSTVKEARKIITAPNVELTVTSTKEILKVLPKRRRERPLSSDSRKFVTTFVQNMLDKEKALPKSRKKPAPTP